MAIGMINYVRADYQAEVGHSERTVIHEPSDLIDNNLDKKTTPWRIPPPLLKILEQIREAGMKEIRIQIFPRRGRDILNMEEVTF